MAADEIEVLSNGPVSASIRTRGRLMHPEGSVAARFEQTFRLDRGSRVLAIDATIEPIDFPSGNPWECYFASRVAWADAAADVLRSAAGGSFPTEAKQVEAPQFVEVRGVKRNLTIFTGGAPYQRRSAMRMLDTILIPQGESRRSFNLSLGVEVPYPYQEAWAQATGLVVADAPTRCPAVGATSWLMHVDAKNLMATQWTPVESNGEVIGIRGRLLETAGRAGSATIRCFRNLVSARQVDYLGQTLTELNPNGDAATIDFSGHEWLEVEGCWRRKEE
jgi:alpha-mannosidase